jgi:Sec-independent protein translocase protein TatA
VQLIGPQVARSLGQSMRILKREVQGLHEDEPEPGPPGAPATARAPAEITVGASDDRRAQIDALQQQIPDLERAAVMHAGPETPATAGTGASRPARQPI